MGWEVEGLEVTLVIETPGMERFCRFLPVLLGGPGFGSVMTNSTSFLFLLNFRLACRLWVTLAK